MLLMLSFVSVSISQAQFTQQCLPDCPGDSFTYAGVLPPITVEVPGQPGCFLTINYGYRFACNTWHDFFIYDIQPSGNCSEMFLSDVNGIVQTATELLFLSNPPVDPSGTTVGPVSTVCNDTVCVTNWRVIRGTCWRSYGTYVAPCSGNACCLKPYQVCADFCGNKFVTSYGTPGGASCNTPEPGCVNVCY